MKCTANVNDTGLNARCSSTNIYPNLILFDHLEARSNSSAGVDLGDGEAYQFVGCDLTDNGTHGDKTTGSVILRSTIGDESGIGTVAFSGCHFEVNKGSSLLIEANAALHLVIEDTGFFQSEGGRAVVMNGSIGSATLTAVKAAGASDVVQISAAHSSVTGGQIFTLADSSTYRHHHLLTGRDARSNWMNTFRLTGPGPDDDLWVWNAAELTGGSVADHMFYKYGRGALTFCGPAGETLSLKAGKVGFFGAAPTSRPTGVAVSAGGIHAALVALGLIAS